MAFRIFIHELSEKANIKFYTPFLSIRFRIIVVVAGLFLVSANKVVGQSIGDYGSAAAGPAGWNNAGSWVVCVTNGTWTGATAAVVVPGAATNVWIRTGHTITMTGNPGACRDLTINGTINWNNTCSGFTTNVSGNLTISGGIISGTRTGNLNVAGTFTVPAGFTASVQRVNLTVTGTTTVSGTLNFATSGTGTKSFYGLVTVNSGGSWNCNVATILNFRGGITNNGTFAGTGNSTYNFSTNSQALNGTSPITFRRDVSIAGNITVTNNTTVTIIRNLTGSAAGSTWVNAANSTLNAGNAVLTTGTLTASAIPNTVNYYRANTQTVKPATYYNLTLSGTSAKTMTGVTVNGVLSMEGTAIASVAPTYGASATLQYNTATARNAGFEWITPFAATGGVVVANTGAITLNAAKVLNANVPLTINSGAILNTSAANNYALTFGGNFINNGTFTANASNITIAGTAVTQSIAGFTTTGLVSLTKASGTATFTGNVNGAGLTINGAGGGILNLGSALTHTFTGVVTLTAGSLNGGSGMLNVNAAGAAWNGTGSVFSAGTGTVNFGAVGAQTLAASSTTFNNLTFSGSGLKTLTTATCTINGILSMEGTATVSAVPTYGAASTLQYKGSALQTTGPEFPALFAGSGGVIINNANGVTLGASSGISFGLMLTSGTFAVGAFTLTLNGPAISGTPTNLSTTSSSSLSFGGSSSGVQIPGSVLALNNLTIANSNGVTLNSSPIISGTLTLTSGILTTGSNIIQAAVAARTTGYVNGSLKLPVATGAGVTKTFYIGDATSYTPVTVVFASVSGAGFLTVNTTAGQHPNISTSGINNSMDVNRYYSLVNSGTAFTTFSPTFTFVPGDIIGGANPANFIIRRYNAGWFLTTIGTRNPTNTTATGVTAFGDFAIGIVQSLDHLTLVLASPQTNGISFTGINTLTARDASNNVMTLFDASADNVTIAANAPLTTGAGAISGLSGTNILVNASDFISGVANLTALGLKYTGVSGTSTFTATSASGKTGTSGNVSIDVGELSISAIGTQTAGTGFSVTITAIDAGGSPVNLTSDALITLTLATGTGTLGGTLTGTILSGTNSIVISGVTYSKAETGVSITATQTTGTPALTPGTSNTFTVNAGAATQLAVSTIATQTASKAFDVIVVSLDANGNPTNVTSATGISLTIATGTGTLGGTTTGTIAIGTNSITIIGVTYNVAETGVSLTASRTSGMALASGTSNTFTVVPDAAVSTLTPTSASITANGSSTQVLTVQAKDAIGNNLSTGGSTVTITKQSGTGTIGAVTDNGNGTYTATVTAPTLSGNGIFVATMNGNPVNNGSGSQTQSTITYIPGAANAVQSALTPASASIADDGVSTQVLTVQAKDINGNLLATGGETVTITKFSGEGNISLVTDNGNGTYTATVTSSVAGLGVFVATLNGNPVMNGTASQSTATITYTLGAVNASASTLTPTLSNIMSGGSAQDLTVQAKDATGNDMITGGATVTITRQSGTGSIGTVTDNNDGTYTATVTSPAAVGSGVFVATLNGAQVRSGTGSQTTATVTYGSSAAQSTLTPTAASITANGTSTIDLTVEARDVSGNDVTVGGETVTITRLSGTGTIGAVTDNGDGSYTATVTSAAAAGSGTFVATLGGSAVMSGTGVQTQAVITYAGPANAAQSTLTPTSATLTADGSSTIVLTVQAKDAGGNNLSTGGATVTITRLSGTGTIGAVADNLDGTYTAIVTAPAATGSGIFVATLGGNPVRNGTASQTQSTITYVPSSADAAISTLTPTSATITSCGSTQLLTVQAKDAYGNNLVTGGATVTITRQSGTGTIGAVTDNGNGTYTGTVTSPSPTTTGNGVFIATLNGAPVRSGTGSQTQATITYTEGLSALISGGLSPICYNTGAGTFTATGSGGSGSFTYLWYANGISTGITTNTYAPGNLTASTDYYCAISSGACGTVNTTTSTVIVNSLPVPTIAGNQVVCTDAIETYTTESGMSNYNWTVAGGTVSAYGTGTDDKVTITWNSTGSQWVRVNYNDSNGCSSASPVQLTVDVFKRPETGPTYYVPNNFTP